MRRMRPIALLLLLLAGPALADDEAPVGLDPDLLARLRHPLLDHRIAAEAEIAACPRASEILAALRVAPEGGLRASAWRAYEQRPDLIDSRRAVVALTDPDARVGPAAARALVRAGAVGSVPDRARIPRGCLGERAQRILTPALARAIETAPADRLPIVVFRLGGGVVPCLAAITLDRTVHIEVRAIAIRLLARVGGSDAHDALVALVRPGALRDRSGVFGVLCGLPLTPAEVGRMYDAVRDSGLPRAPLEWTAVIRHGMQWGERSAFLRLVSVSPPDTDEALDALRHWLVSTVRRRRSPPPQLIDASRALLALEEPQDDVIRSVVRCCRVPWQPRWRARASDLGALLVLLERFRDREAFAEEIADLLADAEFHHEDESVVWETNLPRSVEAWARYLLGTEDPERLEAMATELIVGDGEEPTWPARRLGAQLWNRLGQPPAALVRRLVGDGDPVLRRHALAWREALPDHEAVAAVAGGLTDDDLGVVLAAAAIVSPVLMAATVERLLEAVVEGSRAERGAAWRLIREAVRSRPGAPDPLLRADVGPDTPLDERIRAAYLAREHLAGSR